MRKRKILENRRRILFQQLELISRYEQDFIEELGVQGTKDKVDEILDEINFCTKAIAKIESKNKGNE